MAHDFENLHDIESLDDGELRELVRAHLSDTGGLDVDNITVRVTDGVVHLIGRVGTDGERRIAERAVTDGLGISRLSNDLVVDQLRRSEAPDDAEEANELESTGDLLGDPPEQTSDTTEHLLEDEDGQLFGTGDVGEAIEEGVSYSPPDSPTPEGISGMDGDASAENELH